MIISPFLPFQRMSSNGAESTVAGVAGRTPAPAAIAPAERVQSPRGGHATTRAGSETGPIAREALRGTVWPATTRTAPQVQCFFSDLSLNDRQLNSQTLSDSTIIGIRVKTGSNGMDQGLEVDAVEFA